MRRVVVCMAMLCAGVILAPATASAQAGIAGVVRDTTGAVMPGVTVEASSPVLIERIRVVVSDSAGQYKIVDLPPGTYQIAFTLAGFKKINRTGIVLEGTFTDGDTIRVERAGDHLRMTRADRVAAKASA